MRVGELRKGLVEKELAFEAAAGLEAGGDIHLISTLYTHSTRVLESP